MNWLFSAKVNGVIGALSGAHFFAPSRNYRNPQIGASSRLRTLKIKSLSVNNVALRWELLSADRARKE